MLVQLKDGKIVSLMPEEAKKLLAAGLATIPKLPRQRKVHTRA